MVDVWLRQFDIVSRSKYLTAELEATSVSVGLATAVAWTEAFALVINRVTAAAQVLIHILFVGFVVALVFLVTSAM